MARTTKDFATAATNTDELYRRRKPIVSREANKLRLRKLFYDRVLRKRFLLAHVIHIFLVKF